MESHVTFSFEVSRLPIVLGMGLCLQELYTIKNTCKCKQLICLQEIIVKVVHISLTLSLSLSFFSLRDCKSYIRSSKFLCFTSNL